MVGSAIIEVGIGLVLVFILLSIIVTQVNNVIVNLLNLRGEHLRSSIESIISDPGLAKELLSHPMINVVKAQPRRNGNPLLSLVGGVFRAIARPLFAPHLDKHADTAAVSYVDPKVFSNVMISVLLKDPEVAAQLQNVQVTQLVDFLKARIEDENLERTLETLLSTATSLQEAEARLMTWFNNGMTQLADIFKSHVQYVSFMVGLLLAVFLNIDTIYMAQTFWNDPAVREIAVDTATTVLDNQQQLISPESTAEARNLYASVQRVQRSVSNLFDLRLPIGWHNTDPATIPANVSMVADPYTDARNLWNLNPGNYIRIGSWVTFVILKIVGWILTAFAVMQGSDFWFNLLRQLTGRTQQQQTQPTSGQG